MKIYKITFLALSLFLMFIAFEKFPKYLDQEKYVKIFFISFVLCLSLISIFVNTKFRKNINILFFYFLVIIYSLNLLLSVNYYFNSTEYQKKRIHKKLNIDFDYRDPLTFIKDSKNQNILPLVTPLELMKKNSDILILSGVPNATYIQCNEFGKWKKIFTDSFGFNNSSVDTKYDILLVGDSFAFGVCVEEKHEVHNLLNKKELSTYNAAFSGNGPLTTLATITEINKVLDFDQIVWLFFRNDFYDLVAESNISLLNKYLRDDFDGFSYFSNLEKKSNYQKNYIKNNASNNEGFNYWESFLQLKFISDYINRISNKQKIEEYNNEIFSDIFKVFSLKFKNKKKNIIYLPNQSCFKDKYEICNKEFLFLKKITSRYNLKIHNFKDSINSNSFKEYFAYGIERNHYSIKGYENLANYIYTIINKD